MRPMNAFQRKLLLFLAALALPLLACGGVSVINGTSRAMTVRVSLPDGRVNIARLQPSSTEIWWSAVGGPYSAQALPDEEYMQSLQRLSDVTEQFLATGDPGELYIFSTQLRLGGLDGAFATLVALQHRLALEQEGSALCSGELQDLDLDLDDVQSPDNIEATITFLFDDETGWSCE